MSTTAETSPAKPVSTIRAATPDDVDAVFALVEQLGIGPEADREAFGTVFLSTVANSTDHVILVSERAGTVVAYAVATILHPLYTRGDAAHLQELVVSAAASGHGIGSQLVDAIERECRARGVTQLTVSILRGAGFYERLDYRSTSDYLKKSFVVD
jgi:ribosomal protein S18 acetylase RimI-like enzyme